MRVDGREEEYVEFVLARQTHLRRLGYAVCGRWERADDLLQDALTRVYVAWPRLRRDGTEEVHARRLIVRARVGDRRPRPHQPAPREDSQEDSEDAHLFAALQTLPAQQRKAVVLRHWLGLSVEQTAEDLQISPGSVRSHTAEGLAALGAAGGADATGATTHQLHARLDAALGGDPPHRPLEDVLVAGRRAVRRRRRSAVAGAVAGLTAVAVTTLALLPGVGAGGGVDGPRPVPAPTTTAAPGHVRLLRAPARFVTADTPPVLYLFGRMFRRDRHVDVLATYGEIDSAAHPEAGAIVRVGGSISWVLVVGDEPHSLDVQRPGPYDYGAFMSWAVAELPALSRRLSRGG